MAITEKKQKCGPDSELQTTKICFTYPDARWVCKEPRAALDCDRLPISKDEKLTIVINDQGKRQTCGS